MRLADRLISSYLQEKKKYDLGYASFGNGITIYNKAQEKGGDYVKVAHVGSNRKITFYDKNLPADVKKEITDYAKNANPSRSISQADKVFEQ